MNIRSPELQYRLRYTPAADVALELGGVRSGNWYRCRCPGHGSQSLTLALCNGRDGLVIHCHAGCSRAKVAKALDELGLLGPPAHQARPEPIDPAEHLRRSIQHAARLWHHSLPVGDGDYGEDPQSQSRPNTVASNGARDGRGAAPKRNDCP